MAFQNASQFAITTLNAHTHTHSTVINATSSTSDPISILLSARAVEATHTSTTASYAPKCHPGTRIKVTGHVVGWAVASGVVLVNGSPQAASILWFQGPAGGGKTCIMREVARCLVDANMIIATYFFSNRVSGLGSERPFVATVAHQLLCAVPALKPIILGVVAESPHLFSESVATQMDQLIIRPLAQMNQQDMGLSLTLVIDGFDECIASERGHLLEVLHRLVTSAPSILLILASRPEFDIRNAFNKEGLRSITHFVRLQDFEDGSEIRHYLCDEFCRIREGHPAKAAIPALWPTEEDLDTLVKKSSGNFILPSTVIKHVDNPRRNPVKLLQEVMDCFEVQTHAMSTTNPLSPLDALYTMILHPPEGDVDLLKRILHCVSYLPRPPTRWGPEWTAVDLNELFELGTGGTEMAFCDVHSVVGISEPGNKVVFHHATLHDFLRNKARSRDLFQTRRETFLDVACVCAKHLERWSKGLVRLGQEVRYAGDNMAKILDVLLEGEGPEPFPNTLVQFDTRTIARYSFYMDGYLCGSLDQSLGRKTYKFSYPDSHGNPIDISGSVLARSYNRILTRIPGPRRFLESYNPKMREAENYLSMFESDSGLYDEPL